jgi:hypothetical protein
VRAVDADGDVESDPPDTPAPWQGSATRMTSMPLMGGDGSRRRTSRPVQSRCKKPSSATASGLAASYRSQDGYASWEGRTTLMGVDGSRRRTSRPAPPQYAVFGVLESWRVGRGGGVTAVAVHVSLELPRQADIPTSRVRLSVFYFQPR